MNFATRQEDAGLAEESMSLARVERAECSNLEVYGNTPQKTDSCEVKLPPQANQPEAIIAAKLARSCASCRSLSEECSRYSR